MIKLLLAIFSLAVFASAELEHPCAQNPTEECNAEQSVKLTSAELSKTDQWKGLPDLKENPFFKGLFNKTHENVEGAAHVQAEFENPCAENHTKECYAEHWAKVSAAGLPKTDQSIDLPGFKDHTNVEGAAHVQDGVASELEQPIMDLHKE